MKAKPLTIFRNIEQDVFEEQDKLQAIKEVLAMPTHNGITKDQILNAFRWFFDWAIYEVETDTNAGNNDEMIILPKEAFHRMIARMESYGEQDWDGESWFINVNDAAHIVFEIMREYQPKGDAE